MPVPDSFTFGPYDGLYVGPSTGSSVLKQILAERTDGSNISDGFDERHETVKGNSVQISNNRLKVDFHFLSVDDDVRNLARGNALGTARNTPSQFAKYAVFILRNDPSASDSVWIPECYPLKRRELPQKKDAATVQSVVLVMEERSRFPDLAYFDTTANLQTMMDVRSPV